MDTFNLDMLSYQDILRHYMTYSRNKNGNLSKEEWDEMVALKNAISDLPETVIPEKMEMFSAYLVQSLRQRGG